LTVPSLLRKRIQTAPRSQFGSSITSLGDFDGDAVTDIAVTTWSHGTFILLLNSDGTVKSHDKIMEISYFAASIGDIDGNGVTELAEGNIFVSPSPGSVTINFLNPDGTVKSFQDISNTANLLMALNSTIAI